VSGRRGVATDRGKEGVDVFRVCGGRPEFQGGGPHGRRRRSAIVCGALAWSALLGSVVPAASARQTITIHGSDTMLILNQEWVSEYARRDAGLRFTVLGGGSGRGIAALLKGSTDIAAASRAMKASEMEAFEKRNGHRPREIVVALDGVAVYVHNNNPISSLTIDELGRIFRGEIRNWRQLGGQNRRIDIYNRDEFSGTRAFMQEHVLGGRPFTDRAREVSTTAMLTACVARNQSAIGYGGVAYAQGAHIIRVARSKGEAGVWPTNENVSSGEYPLSRPLHFYVDLTRQDEELQAFLDWVLSPEGQRVVTFVGYYPAPTRAKEPAAEPEASGQAAAPTPPVKLDPIVLSPTNMHRHGFDVIIELNDDDVTAPAGQTMVSLRFAPGGNSIERVRTLSVHIGEEIAIPLTLNDDLLGRFALRRTLIDRTSVQLAEAGAPDKGAVYIIPLNAFCCTD
jgi:phosphate transport system substrate-binding protein